MKILKPVTIIANVLLFCGLILLCVELSIPKNLRIISIIALIFSTLVLNLVWTLYSPEIQKEKTELKKLKIQVEKAELKKRLKELEKI